MARTEANNALTFSEEKDRQMDQKLYNNFTTPEGKSMRRKGIRVFFVIMLVLTICCSLVNWGVITSWGSVRIERLNLSGKDGADYSALIYIPQNATDATPAPALLCFHGNAGNARNHESWAVEFSRRGFVVLSIDQFGAGNSENFTEDTMGVDSLTSVGDIYYQYILTAPFVDHDNIISAGHSMGHAAAVALGATYGAKAIVPVSAPFVPTRLFAKYETEQAQAYVNAINGYTGGFLNLTGLVEASEEEFAQSMLTYLQLRPGFEDQQDYELDTVYGSFEEGNAFCAKLEAHRVHEAAFVSTTTIGNLLWYGQQIVDEVPNPIDYNDQIWPLKDYVGLFGIFVFGLFICAIALLLIEEIPFFEIVKRPVARNIGLRGKGLAISLILGIIIPYIVLKTNALGIIGVIKTGLQGAAPGFRMTYSNVSFGVVIGLNILGVLGFLLYFFTDGKRHKLTLNDLGLTPGDSNQISLVMIGKTALLAVIVIGLAWSYIILQEQFLGTDFYAWFFGFKDIPLAKLHHYPLYIIIWVICFVVASFTINVERRLPTTGKEWLDIAIAMLFNIVAASFTLIVVIVVKWELQSHGVDNIGFWNFGADIQRIWGMPAGMAVGIGGSTLLYRKTGNTWLSAILMGAVAALMCVTFGQVRIHF